MAKTSKKPDTKIHWFWNLTTKLWFFPVFYFFFALILLIYLGGPLGGILGVVLFMPLGLLHWFGLVDKTGYPLTSEVLIIILQVSIYVILAFSIATIHYFKKQGVIIKWLIILIIFLIIASFVGCAADLGPGGYPIGV